MPELKRVLLISYYFPPSAAVGGMRALKFAKYLPLHGWEPIVLTAAPECYEETHSGAERDLSPQLKMYRVRQLPGPRQLILKLKGKSGADVSTKEDTFINQKIQTSSATERGESLKARIRRYVFSFMWLPDDIQGWYPPAVAQGWRCFKELGFDAIFSSGPPWTPHWIARRLSNKTGKPWIADFRDPWTINPWKPYWVVSEPAKRIEQWMERRVVKTASRIICNTENLRLSYQRLYDQYPPEHFAAITNGYDPEDYAGIDFTASRENGQGMTIAYAGNLYGARNPEPLFRSLRILLDQGDRQAESCRIMFIGTKVEGSIRRQAESHGIGNQVEFIKPLPRQDCLKRLAHADVLLLLQPEAHLQIPAKVFEYLQLRRPILTIAGKGATQELIEQTGAGVVVDSDDVDGLTQALSGFLKKHAGGNLLDGLAERDYRWLEFPSLAGQLAEHLNQVTGRNTASSSDKEI